MTTRALVLGSGGATGIAWEAGLLRGMESTGPGAGFWDLVVGSSAGAFVGAWLLSGHLGMLCDRILRADPAEADRRLRAASDTRLVDALRLGRRQGLGWLPHAWTTTAGAAAFGRYAAARGPRAAGAAATGLRALREPRPPRSDELAQVGDFALTRHPRDNPRWLAYWRSELGPVREWPEPLVVTALHLQSGTRRTFDRAAGAPLARVVAASTAVPLLVAPVTIGGERYGDGGTASQTNADLAAGFDEVTIIAPADRGTLDHEVRALRAQGTQVVVLRPERSAAVLGRRVTTLDVRRRPASIRAGVEDGTRLSTTSCSPPTERHHIRGVADPARPREYVA